MKTIVLLCVVIVSCRSFAQFKPYDPDDHNPSEIDVFNAHRFADEERWEAFNAGDAISLDAQRHQQNAIKAERDAHLLIVCMRMKVAVRKKKNVVGRRRNNVGRRRRSNVVGRRWQINWLYRRESSMELIVFLHKKKVVNFYRTKSRKWRNTVIGM